MEARVIPGLPDCVALHCLLHLPFHAIPTARAVCKRWNHELASPSFYRLRRLNGLTRSVVSMLFQGKLKHTVGKLYLALYEPATGICMVRQLAANRTKKWKRCSHCIIIGRELLVFGGWDVLKKRRTGEVRIYDLVSGAWRTGAPMPAPERPLRRFYLKGGKVFAVSEKLLRPTLVYDVAIDAWLELEVPELERNTCQENLCDKFWRPKGEYNRAIGWCKKLLSLDDDIWYVWINQWSVWFNLKTNEPKDIVVLDIAKRKMKPESYGLKERRASLSKHAVETLQRQLGVPPKELDLYVESMFMGDL